MTTKTTGRREQKQQIGESLLAVFPAARIQLPIDLYNAVRRLEVKAHRLAERACNGEIGERACEQQEVRILCDLQSILKPGDVPLFLNGDPRGYALKIQSEYVEQHNLAIHRDWGGYGILAPDLH